jgi:hypothetical protein
MLLQNANIAGLHNTCIVLAAVVLNPCLNDHQDCIVADIVIVMMSHLSGDMLVWSAGGHRLHDH